MPEDQVVEELHALDAIASERGIVLAFRVCEDTDEFEPVFLRVFAAKQGEENEAVLLSLDDGRGISLGRYVLPRSRLEDALADTADIDDEAAAEPAVVPPEWVEGRPAG